MRGHLVAFVVGIAALTICGIAHEQDLQRGAQEGAARGKEMADRLGVVVGGVIGTADISPQYETKFDACAFRRSDCVSPTWPQSLDTSDRN